jgi:hypothetical protein
MALISCPECGNEVSDKAPTCPKCGVPLASALKDVLVHVEKPKTQRVRYAVRVSIGGTEVASGRQGQTLTVPVTKPTEIVVAPGHFTRKKTQQVSPGERWVLRWGTVGYFWERVDNIAGI